MPKLKTHSSTKDKIRITKNGKALYRHAGSNHFLSKKTGARKRRFAVTGTLTGQNAKNMKKKLGV